MKRTNGQGGITLIALVVTIVVLLILAGITITYVLADDGLFGKAQEAEYAQTAGTISDYVAAAQAQMLIESYQGAYAATNAQAAITANFPTSNGWSAPTVTNVTYADHKFGGSFTVVVDTVTYTVTFTDGVAKVTYPQ